MLTHLGKLSQLHNGPLIDLLNTLLTWGPTFQVKVVGMAGSIESCCQTAFPLLFQPNYSLKLSFFEYVFAINFKQNVISQISHFIPKCHEVWVNLPHPLNFSPLRLTHPSALCPPEHPLAPARHVSSILVFLGFIHSLDM